METRILSFLLRCHLAVLLFLLAWAASAQPFVIQPVTGNRCAAVAGNTIRVATEDNVLLRSCTATSGSLILTGFANTTGLLVGMRINGAGIPTAPVPTIVSLTATTVTLTAAATATSTGNRNFFAPAIDPLWVPGPGLTVNASGTGPGLNQYWADVASGGPLDASGFCPSRIAFQWRVAAPTCTTNSPYLGATQVATTVFKSFTTSQLNQRSNSESLGNFQIFSESPPCVGSAQLITMAVKPYHICNPDFTQSQNVGDVERDNVLWNLPGTGWTEVYRSADQTSITLSSPSSITTGTFNFSARLGRCNTTVNPIHAVRTFNVQPSNSFLTISSNTAAFTSLVPGSLDGNGQSVPGSACLAGNSTASFDITMNPAQVTGSAGYQWTFPEGYTCAGTCNTQTITLTAASGTAASSGTVSCLINNGQCGRTIAFFTINRNLVSGVNTITSTRTRPNPVLPSPGDVATWPTACYYPDLNYAFNLGAAPLNNTYTWTPTSTPNPFWTNISGQGTVAFSANANVTNPNASPPSAMNIAVTGVGPALQGGQPICTLTVTNNGTLASQHVTHGLTILQNGISYGVSQTDNGATNWMGTGNFTCNGQALGANHFYYEWGYIGTYTPQGGSGLVNTTSNIVQANNAAAFTINPSQSGANSMSQNPGVFSVGTVMYCRIRKNTSTPQCTGADAARNCFYTVATHTFQ